MSFTITRLRDDRWGLAVKDSGYYVFVSLEELLIQLRTILENHLD